MLRKPPDKCVKPPDTIQSASTGERVELNKKLNKLQAQDTELRNYEEKIHHFVDQMISIDLDDDVKKDYAIF